MSEYKPKELHCMKILFRFISATFDNPDMWAAYEELDSIIWSLQMTIEEQRKTIQELTCKR